MQKSMLTVFILVGLIISFVAGSWYAIRYADADYDATAGLHTLTVLGRSEYWFFEHGEIVEKTRETGRQQHENHEP